MKVNCDSCGKKLNIPDEKIPSNKTVTISCPTCKNKITIEKQPSTNKTDPPSDTAAEAKSESSTEDQKESSEIIDPGDFLDEELEIIDEKVKKALVCDTESQKKIAAALTELDYLTKIAASTNEAMGRIKFSQYDLVVLSENFSGSTLTKNNVLKYIQPMPMATRRKMFVALLGNDFRTMDHMKAFALSVNVVINFKDISNLSAILKKSISDNDAFYKVFKESLSSIGKI